MDLLNRSIGQLIGLLKEKKISSEDLTKSFIKNIKDKKLNNRVYNFLNEEEALEKAKVIDSKREEGQTLGPLAGIPLAIEDHISTKDMVTSAGSKMLENYIPPFNATAIEKLLKSHAIILGKIKIKEFNLEPSDYWRQALDKNGTGAIIGSFDESYKGVSIRPTYGGISRYGLIGATSSFEQISVKAKSVEDGLLIFNQVIGYDGRDSNSINIEKVDFENTLLKNKRKFNLALLGKSSVIGNSSTEAINSLKNLGHKIYPTNMSSIKYVLPAYNILSSAEVASNLGKFDGIAFGYRTKEYGDLEELYKKSRSEALGMESKKKIFFGNYVTDSKQYKTYYERSQKIRGLIIGEMKNILKNNDFILTPLSPRFDSNLMDTFKVLASMTGLPALTLAYNDELSLQFIGKAKKEAQLFEIAYNLEKSIRLEKGEVEKDG